MPVATQTTLAVPAPAFVLQHADDWPIPESKQLSVAAGTVPKNSQSADPWYCDDSWKYDPGFDETTVADSTEDPFYATDVESTTPSYRLDPGLELAWRPDWKTGSGF
jgi:hypothetical protein